MIQPTWLDKMFDNPNESAGDVVKKIAETDEFRDAVVKARAAYYEAEHARKLNPSVMGPGPAQRAREVFLSELSKTGAK